MVCTEDESWVIERARAAETAGDPGLAREILKRVARGTTGASGVRLELAEVYRRQGNLEQAGRWGILIEDWASPAEQNALASLLVRNEVLPDGLMKAVGAPKAARVPEHLKVFYNTRVEALRIETARRQFEPILPDSRLTRPKTAEDTAETLFGVAFVVALVTFVVVGVRSGIADTDLRVLVRIFAGVTVGLVGLGIALTSVAAPDSTPARPRSTAGLIWSTVLLLGAIALVFAGIRAF